MLRSGARHPRRRSPWWTDPNLTFEERVERLTPRERQVMDRLTLGETSAEVGHVLGCSSRTVDVLRQRLLMKLRVRNVVELTSIVLCRSCWETEPS